MNNLEKSQVHLVTGVVIAIDEQDGILIAGMLSNSPFINEGEESNQTKNLIANFAFTRQKAKFLRDQLNEFLKD